MVAVADIAGSHGLVDERRWMTRFARPEGASEASHPVSSCTMHQPTKKPRNAGLLCAPHVPPTQANGSSSTMVSSRSAPVATSDSLQPDNSSTARKYARAAAGSLSHSRIPAVDSSQPGNSRYTGLHSAQPSASSGASSRRLPRYSYAMQTLMDGRP